MSRPQRAGRLRRRPTELTRAEYLAAVVKPKRRFHVLTLDLSRTVRLAKPVSAPSYWFERNELAETEGRYIRDPDRATIYLNVDGKISALFYLVGSRLNTCTFAFDLTPAQLRNAITAMRRAKLTRLILPAATYALEHLPEARRPMLEDGLRDLARSTRRGNRTT